MTAQLASLIQNAVGPDYRIERELDGGGMSRLFLATELRHDRAVVIKVLPPELITSTSAARFKREIQLTVKLQHPHILPILTSGSFEDVLYYITPYIPGESLRARIEREGKLPLDDIVKILRDVSGALAFAHAKGVAHRDVKPGNILLADGQAILADFGIARAIGTTQGTPITTTGVFPGTPAYMAPELPTDEKADVYALGVVGYEMLCGQLPLRGSLVVKEIVHTRGTISTDVAGRLQAIADVVVRATVAAQEQRFENASQIVNDLDRILQVPIRVRQSRSRALAVAVGITLLAIAAIMFMRRPRLDPAKYAIVPFSASLRDSSELVVVGRLADALSAWDGVTLVDQNAARSAMEARHLGRVDIQEAARVAQNTGAAQFIWGAATREGDTVGVRLGLYRTRDQQLIRSTVARLPVTGSGMLPYRSAINALVRDTAASPWRIEGDNRRHNLQSWRLLDSAKQEIAVWALDRAEADLRRSLELETENAPANLWLAQTLAWISDSRSLGDRRAAIRHAINARSGLAENDSILVRGLFEMSQNEFPAACTEFSNWVARDSSSVAAWIGIGDCNRLDSSVVRDTITRGWRFRSSYQQAAQAYLRVAEIVADNAAERFFPWTMAHLSVLPTESNVLRLGLFASGRDSVRFAAHPSLDHDTLAYVPLTFADLATGEKDPPPAAIVAAVQHARDVTRRLAERWVQHAPSDAAAYEQLAVQSELARGSPGTRRSSITGIAAVRTARQLVHRPSDRERLQILEVRLLLKLGDFTSAFALADSVVRAPAGPERDWRSVAGLAILLGRPGRAATLLQNVSSEFEAPTRRGPVELPEQLGAQAWSIAAYASLGVDDSAAAAADRFGVLLPSYFADSSDIETIRSYVLSQYTSLLFPSGKRLLTDARGGDALTQAQRALLAGDSTRARAILVERRKRIAPFLPGVIAMNGTYRTAVLALAVGDTAAAADQLDRVLRALPTLGTRLIWSPEQIGSLLRAFELRARLASMQHDTATAHEWANAVLTLWSSAEPELSARIASVRSIAAR